MKFARKILLPAFALAALQASAASSVLSVSDSLARIDTHNAAQCRNRHQGHARRMVSEKLCGLDYEADKKSAGDLSDAVIIERLSKLPTVIEMPFNNVVKGAIPGIMRTARSWWRTCLASASTTCPSSRKHSNATRCLSSSNICLS